MEKPNQSFWVKAKNNLISLFSWTIGVFIIIFIGFIGGVLSPWFCNFFVHPSKLCSTDPISIANTFIVFTSFIFVAATIVMAIIGFIFARKFSSSQENEMIVLKEELKKKIKNDEETGIQLASELLNNSDVIRHVEAILNEKISSLIDGRLKSSEQECQVLNGMKNKVRPENGGSND